MDDGHDGRYIGQLNKFTETLDGGTRTVHVGYVL